MSEMSWEEASEAFQKTDVAIVPIGSNETHGPHNPMGTDTFAAEEIAKRIGEKSGAIVTPVIPFGYSPDHTDFPGTLSLKEETLYRMLVEICRQLHRYGIRRVIFLTGHGGNLAVLQTVAMKIRQEMGMLPAIPLWWRDEMLGVLNPKWAFEDHGGMKETAQNLAIVPHLVNLEKYRPSRHDGQRKLTDKITLDRTGTSRGTFIFKGIKVQSFLNLGDSWPEGFQDSPEHPANKATAEGGEAIIGRVSTFLAEFVTEFKKIPLPLDPIYPKRAT